jgi:uncharacterized protein
MMMRDYDTTPSPEEPVRREQVRQEPVRREAARVDSSGLAPGFANPAPLGLNVLAFATAILGCFYTGFIIPYQGAAIRPAVGAVLIVSGIVLVIAGILEYRKNSMLSATIFTAYGAFLAAIGLVFLPNFGILSFLISSRDISFALGLFFLCWTIFSAILFLGALQVNMWLAVTMLLLFCAYVALTVGQLAGNNSIANHVGGWLAIAAALAAWLTSLVSLISTEGAKVPFPLPTGGREVNPVD